MRDHSDIGPSALFRWKWGGGQAETEWNKEDVDHFFEQAQATEEVVTMMHGEYVTNQNCPSCGSDNIVQGIHVGKTAEIGDVGLSYQQAMILTGTEPMLADLCTSCGLIVRLRVKNPDRKW